MAQAFYVVRYLEPKEAGLGEFLFSFSHSDEDLKLKQVVEMWPELFESLGSYSLMKATGSVLTVGKKK